MDITSQEQGGVTVATVSGDIDGKSAARAQSELLALLGAHPVLVLDVTQVGYMSSAGLRVMLLLYRQAAARNGRVVLVGLSDEIKDTMSMTGFLSFFTVARDVAEALNVIGKEPGL
jgi:anti-sigma B factor antagonist